MNSHASTFLVRQQQLIWLLTAFIVTGLVFCLFPGTLIGVLNLFSISQVHSTSSLSAASIQAHGHAQLFGWIGSFILGIGFYSIPSLRHFGSKNYLEGWLTWFLWTSGVTLRWFSQTYSWHWQEILPISAVLEFMAVAIFIILTMISHKQDLSVATKQSFAPWIWAVTSGTMALLAATIANFILCLWLSTSTTSPVFPEHLDKQLLVMSCWGFIVPIIVGFTAHWLPPLLGIGQPLQPLFLFALIANWFAIIVAILGSMIFSSVLLIVSSACWIVALHMFEPARKQSLIKGVHWSFPIFIRIAYAWLLISSVLSLIGSFPEAAPGYLGASRHALTVGFFSLMVLNVGPRMLPTFLAKRALYSTTLMGVSSLLLTFGCAMRVVAQILSYGDAGTSAWMLLPASATIELLAIIGFACNIFGTVVLVPTITQSCILSTER